MIRRLLCRFFRIHSPGKFDWIDLAFLGGYSYVSKCGGCRTYIYSKNARNWVTNA